MRNKTTARHWDCVTRHETARRVASRGDPRHQNGISSAADTAPGPCVFSHSSPLGQSVL